MTTTNPFLLTGYVSPDYFCDRDNETAKLQSALRNGRNVTLISPRRMGKTGLIRHTFYLVEQAKEARCFYVDLYQTDSLQSLVTKLASTVLGQLDSTEEKVVRKISSFFKSLRPAVTFDPVNGQPSYTVAVQAESAEASLAEVLQYLEQAHERCYVAFDEFQSINDYEDKKVEALLRAHIQHLTNVQFIFSGSQRHVLENMFATAGRPFYQSTQLMHLGSISPDAYLQFAREKFVTQNIDLPDNVFSLIYNRLSGHTWYVQCVLNRIFETCEHQVSLQFANDTIEQIVEEYEPTYISFMRLVTAGQKKLLKAIAAEHSVNELLSNAFLSRHNLGATSSVKSAAKVLVERELLLHDNDGYQVYDRFLEQWLKR